LTGIPYYCHAEQSEASGLESETCRPKARFFGFASELQTYTKLNIVQPIFQNKLLPCEKPLLNAAFDLNSIRKKMLFSRWKKPIIKKKAGLS
jgi:hypothetical protein